MAKVIVVVEGGIVQEVLSKDEGIEVEVIDLDTEEEDDEYADEVSARYDEVCEDPDYHCIY